MFDEASIRMDLDARHTVVRVDGVRLHWLELGQQSDHVPVVFLHGLNDSHLSWRRVAPLLARDRRVIVPDLPGHGRSARPDASYELRWHARIMAKWLETIGVQKADIVGHSFGGGVAQVMLLECPARIRRLVLVASGGLGREVTVTLRLAAMPRVVELFGQRFMALATRIALYGYRAGFSKEEVEELSAMNCARGSARAFARTVRDVIDYRGQRRSFYEGAGQIAELPPIAVCWGDRDVVIPVTHAKTFASLVEGVVFTEFKGCGHYLHNEQPVAFARTVREFLDEPAVVGARLRSTSGPVETRVRSARGPDEPAPQLPAPAERAPSVEPTLKASTRLR